MKLVCAPMATLSHEAFRVSVEEFGGCDEYFTEMINASSLLNMGPFEKYYLMNGPCPQKIVWQLTGASADKLAEAAEIVCENGGTGVDLNMGCSAPQIYKTGAGIAWMLKPLDETARAVTQVKKALERSGARMQRHFRLSIKCRLGGEDFTEQGFMDFIDTLVENGAELITLHARTIKEKYRGLPRHEFAQKILERHGGKIKVYVNGCVKDTSSARLVMDKAPDADGIMIARAAAERPWIFAQIKKELDGRPEKITVDRMNTALRFIDNVEKFQPVEFHRTRIQRFFSYYCAQFKFGHYFQTRMLNYKSNDESRREILSYFEKQPEERYIEL